MSKNIKIVASPFSPNLEVAFDMVIKLHVPYSEDEVTVQVSPNIQDYQENQDQPGVKVRQVTVTTNTDETQTLKFDFKDSNVKTVHFGDKSFEIKLMQIGKVNLEGQDFLYFEFFIAEK